MNQPQIDQILQAISQPKLYNDSRDQIIGNFNRIQAIWGTGKAFYDRNSQPFELTESLPTQRFKAIGYAQRRTNDQFRNKQIDPNQTFSLLLKSTVDDKSIPQVEQNFRYLFGGANCNVKIESNKSLPDNKCQLTVSVSDSATQRKYPANEVLKHLSQPLQHQQLQQIFSNNLIELSQSDFSEKDVEEYLNRVPDGIEPKVWEQAKLNNPDSKNFIPIPLIGFQALNERFKMQQFETQQQRARLRQLSNQVAEMQKHAAAMKSKLEECRRKKVVLSNRVLKVLIMQEIERRRGFPIQADEEKLRTRMESILAELHAQTKYKGCLNELMSQLKQVQNQQHRSQHVHLDEQVVEDIKNHLKNELHGIEHLIKIINQDNELIARSQNNTNNPSSNSNSKAYQPSLQLNLSLNMSAK